MSLPRSSCHVLSTTAPASKNTPAAKASPRYSPTSWIAGAILVGSVLCTPVFASFEGKVIGVVDGDTVTVLKSDKTQERVSLLDARAPTKGDDFSVRAREFLSDLLYLKDVTVSPSGRNPQQEIAARITVPTEAGAILDVAEELLDAGLAWHFEVEGQDAYYFDAQESAKSAKRGL